MTVHVIGLIALYLLHTVVLVVLIVRLVSLERRWKVAAKNIGRGFIHNSERAMDAVHDPDDCPSCKVNDAPNP